MVPTANVLFYFILKVEYISVNFGFLLVSKPILSKSEPLNDVLSFLMDFLYIGSQLLIPRGHDP